MSVCMYVRILCTHACVYVFMYVACSALLINHIIAKRIILIRFILVN